MESIYEKWLSSAGRLHGTLGDRREESNSQLFRLSCNELSRAISPGSPALLLFKDVYPQRRRFLLGRHRILRWKSAYQQWKVGIKPGRLHTIEGTSPLHTTEGTSHTVACVCTEAGQPPPVCKDPFLLLDRNLLLCNQCSALGKAEGKSLALKTAVPSKAYALDQQAWDHTGAWDLRPFRGALNSSITGILARWGIAKWAEAHLLFSTRNLNFVRLNNFGSPTIYSIDCRSRVLRHCSFSGGDQTHDSLQRGKQSKRVVW